MIEKKEYSCEMNSRLLGQEEVVAIFKAAQSGDTAAVRECLDLGVPVDLTDEDGWSPVHHAIAHGQVEVIRLLMDRGCRMVPVKNSNLSANEDILKDGDTGGDIFDAARSGDTAKLKEYLELGVSVDVTDEDGRTPLHCAAGEGQVGAVKLLIEKGCCFDLVDKNGWTPSIYATMQGQDEVEVLLKLAQLVRDPTGSTLLRAAAADGQLEVIEMLLSVGGRKLMTMVDGKAGTPLHQAARHGHKDVVACLLNEGCPIDIRDSNGFTALYVAAQRGHVVIIEMLAIHGSDVNVVDNEGMTPLHSAANCGQLESIHTLLKLGGRKSLAIANAPEDFLHPAVIHDQLESVNTLLRSSGKELPTKRVEVRGTPLHQAAGMGHKEIVALLLNEGCPIGTRDNHGYSALHLAACFGRVHVIEELVNHGLDVNVEDNEGCTPLHYAATHGQLKSVQTLLQLGGRKSLTKTARKGGTPLHQAVASGIKDVVTLFLNEGCPVTTLSCSGASALHVAAQFGQEELIEYLIDCGLDANIEDDDGRTRLDVNLVDNEGCTPLHAAAAQGQLESVRTLLRLGGKASMTMVVGKYGTPLHQAVGKGYNDIVTLLLDEGCPVNVTTCDGLTALHFAAINERVDLVGMLVKRGCDVNAVDVYGWTPVFYALNLGLMKRLCLFGARISHYDNFGINVFEYFIAAFQCVSSQTMKSYVEASGITCDGSNFVNVISTLSENNLFDINRVLCLAAVSGHVDIFDDIVDSDLPLDQQRMPKLVRALCIRLESWKVIQNVLEELHILDDPLNPVQLSLISCQQLGPGAQSTSQHKYAERVISHPRTKYTIYELFPNGLSPLDVARQFELHDIASVIERAGGRPGMWADLPKEMGQKSMEILRSLKRVRGSEFGEDCIRTLLMMCGCVIKEEEGSKAAQNVLEKTPEQSDMEKCILSNVKNMRKWRRVGDLLKLEAPVLDKLAKVADGNDDAYYSMLKYWLEHGCNVTWKTLLDAIGYFETKKTMDHIRKKIERGLSVTNVGRHVTCWPLQSGNCDHAFVVTT